MTRVDFAFMALNKLYLEMFKNYSVFGHIIRKGERQLLTLQNLFKQNFQNVLPKELMRKKHPQNNHSSVHTFTVKDSLIQGCF